LRNPLPHVPFQHIKRHGAWADHHCMKFAQVKSRAEFPGTCPGQAI
jgi:hypothetical protein